MPKPDAWDLVDLFYVDDVTTPDDEIDLDDLCGVGGGVDRAVSPSRAVVQSSVTMR